MWETYSDGVKVTKGLQRGCACRLTFHSAMLPIRDLVVRPFLPRVNTDIPSGC